MEKQWQVHKPITQEFANQFPEINPIILQLLVNRGINSQEKIDEFLNPDYSTDLHDPFLLIEMEKAVERILKSIEAKEKIIVYGDYDTDGVSSSVIMVSLIKALGGQVDVYIPFRETEGYGLNAEAVKQIAKNKTDLVITVDCGISNAPEVEILKEKGVDIIITDHHHEPLTIPQAFAILNPNLNREKYPFKPLAGCGVAYKVAQAVIARHKKYKVNQLADGFEKWFLDLVAIGTIADLMPLIGENRTLVRYGLTVLQKTKRLGLQELIKIMGNQPEDIDERAIGWQIAPRLNAAGRLNHASASYQLLITNDQREAERLAQELNQTNQQRQQITDKINLESKEILGEVKNQKILIVVGTNWPTGIVGLIAGRLTDEFHRPSLVISKYNGEIIGSGRSIPAFNIIEAIEKSSKFLARYGGHSQACGFTVKDDKSLDSFIKATQDLAENQLTDSDLQPVIDVDTEVKLEEIDWELFENLEKFIPFGEGNRKPKFLAKDLTINELQTVGKDAKHLRLMVKHNTEIIRKTIGFCFGNWCTRLKRGDTIDMVFELDVNEWNGNRELQLKIVDLKR